MSENWGLRMTQAGRRPLVAGNWKMNGTRSSIAVVEAIRDGLSPDLSARIDVLICPPSTLIGSCVAATYGSSVAIGGQNLMPARAAPSPARSRPRCWPIWGPSSHRRPFEAARTTTRPMTACMPRRSAPAGPELCGIICVGETIEEREQGRALDIVRAQLAIGLPRVRRRRTR